MGSTCLNDLLKICHAFSICFKDKFGQNMYVYVYIYISHLKLTYIAPETGCLEDFLVSFWGVERPTLFHEFC